MTSLDIGSVSVSKLVIHSIPKTTAADRKSPAVVQAKLSLADMQLSEACKQLFEDRKAANSLLEKAEQNFKDVDAGATDTLTRCRARLGCGTDWPCRRRAR